MAVIINGSGTIAGITPGGFPDGTITMPELDATGTPSSTTFLRGDGTWAQAGFESGTMLVFSQTNAPTGWTKSTSHDNKALRVVSGTASSGGSVAFTTAFASQTPSGSVSVTVTAGSLSINNTTLSEAQMPSHSHYYAAKSDCYTYYGNNLMYSVRSNSLCNGNYQTNMYSSSTGSSGAHTHGLSGSPSVSGSSFTGSAIDLAVQYVDVILAVKD